MNVCITNGITVSAAICWNCFRFLLPAATTVTTDRAENYGYDQCNAHAYQNKNDIEEREFVCLVLFFADL